MSAKSDNKKLLPDNFHQSLKTAKVIKIGGVVDNFIKLVAAFGLGGLIVKLVDIYVLQRYLVKKELNSWLRDKKLVAYSLALENLLSMGFKSADNGPYEDLASLSQALLLVKDAELHELIESHIFDRAELHDCEPNSPEEDKLFPQGGIILC